MTSGTAPVPARGDIWWAELADVGRRPVLVLTRDEAILVLRSLLVAPITRTVRGIPTEVPLGRAHGLAVDCAATLDNVQPTPKSLLTRRAGRLIPGQWAEVCEAWRAVIDC